MIDENGQKKTAMWLQSESQINHRWFRKAYIWTFCYQDVQKLSYLCTDFPINHALKYLLTTIELNKDYFCQLFTLTSKIFICDIILPYFDHLFRYISFSRVCLASQVSQGKVREFILFLEKSGNLVKSRGKVREF